MSQKEGIVETHWSKEAKRWVWIVLVLLLVGTAPAENRGVADVVAIFGILVWSVAMAFTWLRRKNRKEKVSEGVLAICLSMVIAYGLAEHIVWPERGKVTVVTKNDGSHYVVSSVNLRDPGSYTESITAEDEQRLIVDFADARQRYIAVVRYRWMVGDKFDPDQGEVFFGGVQEDDPARMERIVLIQRELQAVLSESQYMTSFWEIKFSVAQLIKRHIGSRLLVDLDIQIESRATSGGRRPAEMSL